MSVQDAPSTILIHRPETKARGRNDGQIISVRLPMRGASQLKKKTGGAHASCTTTFSVIQSVKELSLNAHQGFNPESGCKGKDFKDTNQIILRKNSKNNGNFILN